MRETENTELLKKRFTELSRRADLRSCWEFSSFLSLAEQSILMELKLPSKVSLWGGYEGAERRIAVFGSEEDCGYTEYPPIVCVKIEPANKKFAEELSHRDFLGSLMGLGIEREVLGDIVIKDSEAWLFCLESISGYVIGELTSVRRTTVKCSLSEPPEYLNEKPEITSAVTASERLDGVVAAVYNLSRSEGKKAVESGKVFLDGLQVLNPSAQIKQGTIVSVRGTGRFIYEGIEKETRRGRLRVLVRKY